ncbi:uncharacterized protein AMSG_01616 [Thecamonas trahens ATCC 50062]|uniref:Uncharacterized protein n=1 Tax=Thecamonas trahens ATCC 50062 TaxID=461836 RepID=A0A0L0DR63_THETB|nr:hypothetical protein AMSG_01616 [Thecamonas trahens ATCC 50062]KNC54765.1 hypothetical protein AMSG_01616 [Thecamonas trahens ATCC 50062]|eukprot:XP_013761665.1 hypothetical protein AMSG_01616 [Thecamonas trahens ATCC 50062]
MTKSVLNEGRLGNKSVNATAVAVPVEPSAPKFPSLETRLGTISPTVLAVICVIGAVLGGVTQNVALPLWLVALDDSSAGANPYFVLTFASAAYVVIFGLVVAYLKLFTNALGEVEARFPHKFLALIGACDALNGILVVFASPPQRTAPFLQALLGNAIIPFTFAGSYLLLHRKTTWKHVACAALCVLGLLIALTPTIFNLDDVAERYSSSSSARYVWPMVFMVGFLPAALMNIYEEKVLKTIGASASSMGRLNLYFMLFWTSLYQLLTAGLAFWAAFIPGFGVSTAKAFPNSMWVNLQCTFGGAGCSWAPFFAVVFIGGYVASYVFGGFLFRYASANYNVVASSLVTPLGALFWTFFRSTPFGWDMQVNYTTWLSLSALPVLLAGIMWYHRLEAEDEASDGAVDIDALDLDHGEVRTMRAGAHDYITI